mmetsp:Transcript_24063/g.58474  ORF Transcript_24063/g.58474 Transcript_24063/m.58474 type:complete len:202 (-) Transcript_24063:84-689(-)
MRVTILSLVIVEALLRKRPCLATMTGAAGDDCGDDGPQAKSCTPDCKWHCTNPTCEQVCQPMCAAPTCKTYCKPLRGSMQKNGCRTHCADPKCTVVCPHTCTSGNCPKCRTVCGPPVCETDCNTDCVTKCADPVCNFHCEKPSNCSQPVCSMQCSSSGDCLSGPHNDHVDSPEGLAPYSDATVAGLASGVGDITKAMTGSV